MTGTRHRLRRLLAGAAVALAAATAAPLATTSPAAAADEVDCSATFRVGDVSAQVCWHWKWVGAPLKWRPTAFYLYSGDASKRLYVGFAATATREPEWVYLGAKDGNASFGVPTLWDWNMVSNQDTTTTHVARRLPGRTADCLAKVRHDRGQVFLISVTGQCSRTDPV